MITRKQYIANEATHREYYGQFVTESMRDYIASVFGDRLANSTYEHFNDIPLSQWDDQKNVILAYCGKLLAIANGGGVSLSDCVCVAKEAARQIRESIQ